MNKSVNDQYLLIVYGYLLLSYEWLGANCVNDCGSDVVIV